MTTLSDVFAMVTVTSSQGIEVLNKLAEGSSDRDPTLTAAFNEAISQLSNPPVETKEETADISTSTSTSATSSRTSSRS